MKIKVLILLCFTYLLFFYNLGGIALWDPDEPRQAIMAREMMERHDYIHPYLNGKPYLEKPPFYPWMIIAASKVTGTLNEFSARMPAAVSATMLVLVTFMLGSVLLDARGGLISAAILATNYQFLSNARESVMDMTFAFFIGLTIYLTYLALRRRHKWLFALAFLPSALAILTKGPAGLVIPAGVIFIFIIKEKEVKRFFGPMALGCLLSTAIASIWFIMAGPEYIKEFIVHQNFTRYTNAFDHAESLGYYFHKLFINFLPWSIFLPFAVYHGYRKKYWLPFIWFVFTFLFFEFSTSKRAIYLLSCYPAIALLSGFYLRDKWSELVHRGIPGYLLKALAVLLAFLPIVSVVVLRNVSNQTLEVFRSGPSVLYLYLGLLFVAGGAFFTCLLKKLEKGALISFFVYLTISGLFYNVLYMPVIDEAFKSPLRITDKLKSLTESRDIWTFGFSSAGLIYYVGKPIHMFLSVKQIKEDKRDILLIVEDRETSRLQRELNARYVPVGKARYEKEYYTFYVRKDGR
ncbi:MAG: glycosyltransferase family 39 protein [Syntrophobacterales bacterium]|jgi:4-amino-4-deoxy-L-arabinose transferase-like glycosyltransferase|nr:glycosyltransferase family 39 protein [Syntrophobacterales bacterium]